MPRWIVGNLLLGIVAVGLALGLSPDARAQAIAKPSQIYLLRAQLDPSGEEELYGPDGPFSVPEKQVLILLSVNILPISPGPGVITVILEQGASMLASWNVPMDQPTFIPYPAGFKLHGGGDLVLRVASPPASDGSVSVELNGFLTRDK